MKSRHSSSKSKRNHRKAGRANDRLVEPAKGPGRVLMLGWAFPAYLSGGVGTACQGLCRALTRAGVGIDFVMSGPSGEYVPEGVEALPLAGTANVGPGGAKSPDEHAHDSKRGRVPDSWDAALQHARDQVQQSSGAKAAGAVSVPHPYLEFIRIDVNLDPYLRPGGTTLEAQTGHATAHDASGSPAEAGRRTGPIGTVNLPPPADLFNEVDCYTHQAIQAAANRKFECIHAHDWMTFQAGAAIAEASGKPLVAHVHSTEFERTAHHINERIFEIEKSALHRADAVIAVSHMAREVLVRRYAIPETKISVIYNGVDCNTAGAGTVPPNIVRDEKIVLFMGRMTLQKGPEYFLAAARKVLEVIGNVRFIMAGSGELLEQTMGLAEQLGISDRVVFPGFLRGEEVERMFRSADLYVMPSVSDPFGIAALEAVSYDVPVLVSRQSGVSEVLRHVLKTDFWDIDDMADKIVAVLRHPPLQATLRKHAGFEIRSLSWTDAARKVANVYGSVTDRLSIKQEQAG